MIPGPAGAALRSRWAWPAGLLALGLLVLIPTWIVLPPDDENLSKEILTTVFQSREIFSGHYPFWDPFVAFGTPEPRSQALIFHPFLLFVELLPLGAAIGAFYQLQLWIGILSVWGLARHFGIRRWMAAVCAFAYALSPTVALYLNNFWPVNFVLFTLAPLLLLLLVKLFDAGRPSTRALYAVAAGLCAGLMILDGHLGWAPDYALPFLAFLGAQFGQVRRRWQWLAVSGGVLVLAALSHVYDVALESSNAVTSRNNQETVGMNLWRLFAYPIAAPFHHGNNPRALALGGAFFVLALIGLVYPLRHPYANGLRAGAVTSFGLWFLPLSWTSLLSTNWALAAPFTLFALVLAGLTLQALWQRSVRTRRLAAGLVLLQVVALAAGFFPTYRDGLRETVHYLDGSPASHSLKHALANQPIYRYFERVPGIRETRVYLAAGADARLFRKSVDYKFEGWALHGLRLVNGLFKGVDMHEITPARVYLRGEIRGDPRVSGSATTLDALGIGYVLATTGDRVAPDLRKIATFRLHDPTGTIVAYRNPGVWPDAVLLDPKAKRLGTLPRRTGCASAGLLCADFEPVDRLRVAGAVQGAHWAGADLSLRLRPRPGRTVLALSQLYRPGWQATLSDGRTVSGYRLFGGFTGFDLPPDVGSATVSFDPTARAALTALSWFTIFASFLVIAGIAFVRRPRRLP